MKKIVWLVALLCLSGTASAYKCKYEREIDRVVDLQGFSNIEVEAGAGSLEIVGGRRDDVRIKAKLCADDDEDLATMDVVTEFNRGKVLFDTRYPKRSGWSNNNATIDLELMVPSNSKLDVQDSSGEAQVEGIAQLDIVDSSGRLEIKDIDGDVTVIDSSGALDIANVGGDVNLTDSSGGIYVTKVGGNMVVEVDSSGEIKAREIGKDVLIKIDSSGAIDVRDVGGDFTVEKDSSGGIKYEEVAGKVKI